MRVKCANCGMVYDINPTPMDFRSPAEVLNSGVCPGCGSNAKDKIPGQEWKSMDDHLTPGSEGRPYISS